jgi:uncharacterized protein
MDKPLCIYHGNCADGFMAATIIRHGLGAENVDFHAGIYQQPPPDVAGRDVIMVDFSYKRPVLLGMAASARSILILDHHKSAEADLVDLPDNVVCQFDMNRSGAMLAWNYVNPTLPPPAIVQHVQDRDLWRFELPLTREIQTALFSYAYDFDAWTDFLTDADKVSELAKQGEALVRKHNKDVKELIGAALDEASILGYRVPLLNAPYFFSSEAGHILCKGHPFAACYYVTADGVNFSLRSDDKGVDVSAIASVFGGGGHAQAAGFRVDFCQFLRLANYWIVRQECE